LGVSHMVRTFDPSYKAARAVRLIGLPTTLLIDPDGREVGRLAGEADWDSPQVHALLDFHMNK
ncbi:MAG: TlpA family protein disulfide reductase, partial [Parvibaculales bacterium]